MNFAHSKLLPLTSVILRVCCINSQIRSRQAGQKIRLKNFRIFVAMGNRIFFSYRKNLKCEVMELFQP